MGMYKDKCKSEGSNTQVQYVSYTNTHTHHTHALTKIGARVGAFDDGMFTGVIQDRSLG